MRTTLTLFRKTFVLVINLLKDQKTNKKEQESNKENLEQRKNELQIMLS